MAISGITDFLNKPYYRTSFPEMGIGKNDRGEDNTRDLSNMDIQALVDSLNKESSSYGSRIAFTYNEKAHSVIMKVIDGKTSEVIREIPAKDAVRLVENIREYLGAFIDEKM